MGFLHWLEFLDREVGWLSSQEKAGFVKPSEMSCGSNRKALLEARCMSMLGGSSCVFSSSFSSPSSSTSSSSSMDVSSWLVNKYGSQVQNLKWSDSKPLGERGDPHWDGSQDSQGVWSLTEENPPLLKWERDAQDPGSEAPCWFSHGWSYRKKISDYQSILNSLSQWLFTFNVIKLWRDYITLK